MVSTLAQAISRLFVVWILSNPNVCTYHVMQCVIIVLHPIPGKLLSLSAYEAQIAWRLPYNAYFLFVWSDINNVSNEHMYYVHNF